MLEDDAPNDASARGVSVGVAAARLGVTASTLRSWGTRYGIDPSLRTKGGHRRYSDVDLARLDQVRTQIQAGAAPAAAAAATRPTAPASLPVRPRRGAGPGGRVLAVPGADAARL